MTTYLLHSISTSVHYIMSGGKKVGFVNACPVGYVARIGKHCETAPSLREAFNKVAVKALGYDNVEELNAHNSVVRTRNKARNATARYVVDQALNHKNFEPLVDMLSAELPPKK
jgi:hypothetical protein